MNLNQRMIVAVLFVLIPWNNAVTQSITAFNEVNTNVKRAELHHASRAQLKADFIKTVKSKTEKSISILVPDENGHPVFIDFEPYKILSDDFKLTDQTGKEYEFEQPQFFKGKLQDKNGFATMTVFKDRISAVLSIEGQGNVHIAQDKESKNPFEYWIYNDQDRKEEFPFTCHTQEDNNPIPKEAPTVQRSVDQCVEVYLEADYFMFQDYGTTQGVMNYITEIWVHVAALFAAEEITTNISEIFVWTNNDPYSDTDGGEALLGFSETRTSYNGDLAHLVTTNPGNLGGIAFLDVLCTEAAYGFSNFTPNYSALPNYSWTINVLTHEIGHQLGAYHTHSCNWPNGPIDDCAPIENGPCNPGPTPTNGGTIMSYCHLTGIGIDFNNGFGLIAGDYIRERTADASCLQTCDGSVFTAEPTANFTFDYITPCAVGTVSFTNTSLGNPSTFSWQFEGGIPSSSLEENPVVQYLVPGSYNVTLTVTNEEGIDSEIRNNAINILDDPAVSYSYSETSTPNTFEFTATGSNITNWFWEFGDGSSSSMQNPTHSYGGSGSYEATLTGSNACGTIEQSFSVSLSQLAPIAAFSQNNTSGCAPLAVNFLDQSLNNPTEHNWQLPGGTPNTSDFHSPFVAYQTPGVYDVILQVSNSEGFDTEIKQDLITVEPGPIANFSPSIMEATVAVGNTAFNIDEIMWDFGDGNTSSASNPMHTYQNNGTYTITQTVDNECGTDVHTETINISAYPEPAFSVQSFDGCAPFSASFSNTSINSNSIVWEFPGGSPANSTSNNPSVVYQNPGLYTVLITVTNSFGTVTETFNEVIDVGIQPVADFTFENVGLNYSFENQSLYGSSFMWDFGDGNFSSEENPQHLFGEEGTYSVSLEINGVCGTDTETEVITIFNLPSASINSGQTEYCVGEPVSFNANISSNATDYEWTITGPEEHTSDLADPTFFLETPGLYSVRLEVSNPSGSDVVTLSNYLRIRAEPVIDFSYDINILQVSFQSQISQANSVLWSFGDGATSTQFNPTHQYAVNGEYLVSLTAINDCGGTSFSETINLDQLTFANFEADKTAFCQGEFVQFQNNSTMSAEEYRWDFPGGTPSSSTEENPMIFYDDPGVYDVSLYVNNGITDDEIVINDYIQVDASEAFEIENAPLIAYIPTNIRFNYTNNFPGDYAWDFGDGNQSTVPSPVYEYDNEGTYEVTLNYSNSCFELDTTFLLYVYSRPEPEFAISNNEGCAPFTVNINNLSPDNYEEIEWSAPGSVEETSDMVTPVFTYLNGGEYDITLKLTNPLFEETQTIEQAIRVLDTPIADFTYDANGFNVNFDNASELNTSQTWNFGDGESSTAANPSHTYLEEGSYVVNLEAKNVCGIDLVDQLLHLYTRPTADFEAKVIEGCLPANISFDNFSSDNSLEYQWVFEGAEVTESTDRAPVARYNTKGVYDVVLIVSNPLFSDTMTLENYITINDVAETDFDFTNSGLDYNFINQSVDALDYRWDFGDGTLSFDENPVHEYAAPGNYFVSLTTTNGCGSNSASISIGASDIPAANFSVDFLKQCRGSEFTFFNFSDDATTSYLWSFPGATEGSSTEIAPTIVYNTPGVFDVSLIAYSDAGADTAVFENYIEVQDFPVAAFETELIGSQIQVTNNSIGADTYSWVAGTQLSAEENPVFNFDSNGEFVIELTVSNVCGVDMESKATAINSLPVIDFVVTERACIGDKIVFESLSANVDNLNWYINNELVGSSADPIFEYTISEPGIYDVLLVGVNQFGQSELRKEQSLEIVGPPVADFDYSFFGDQILFTDLSQYGVDYLWDFGDGFIAVSGGDQFHLFAEAGIYQVMLRVENECGSDTIIKTVNADLLLPQPQFFSNHDPCVPTTLDINNETTGDITSWYWRLSGPDTIESFLKEPILNIVKPGSYDLYLEFSNQYGGVSEFFESYIFVDDVPNAEVALILNGRTLQYENIDIATDEYSWDFGDGGNAIDKTGIHEYTGNGNYDITHIATNVCGDGTYNETVVVNIGENFVEETISSMKIQPSPTESTTVLEFSGYIKDAFEIQIINNLGQVMRIIEHPPINGVNQTINLDVNHFLQGIYHVWIKADDYRKSANFVKI